MRVVLCSILLFFLLLVPAFVSPLAAGAELPPAETAVSLAIDHSIETKLQEKKIEPAKPASDLNFLRRVTLDLAGRIPTSAEGKAYAAAGDSLKSVGVVDALLASPDFAYHQRNEIDSLLLARLKTDEAWRVYLLTAARENRPWDQLFREMMTSRDEAADKKQPALEFLRARSKSVEEMTNDTSSLFFGVSINCAKCHDHPLVDDWKQDHFYGMTSFFSRTYLTKKGTMAEKQYGRVSFKPANGDEKKAPFMFLSGAVVEEPAREITDEQRKAEEAEVKRQREDDKAPLPAPPKFSPRAKLVELALGPENNRFFARSIVNRVWGRLMGRALIDPPDQMHSGNEASHPELLDWLVRDLVAHRYDLKRLIRGIVLSRAYARSSQWEAKGDPPDDDLFAVSIPRPLSPRQFSLSLGIAAMNPSSLTAGLASDEWAKKRESLETEAGGFARQIERPGENFSISVDEALLFSNSEEIQSKFLGDAQDKLVGFLQTIEKTPQLIEEAYWAVLTRVPSEEERAAMAKFLENRKDRRTDGIRQMVWALLCSPEMRFNY